MHFCILLFRTNNIFSNIISKSSESVVFLVGLYSTNVIISGQKFLLHKTNLDCKCTYLRYILMDIFKRSLKKNSTCIFFSFKLRNDFLTTARKALRLLLKNNVYVCSSTLRFFFLVDCYEIYWPHCVKWLQGTIWMYSWTRIGAKS